MAPMGISHYIKDIGRGKAGARALTREQAADLMGQVLDGTVTDLELGAFCIAMRIKGETPDEMAGFLHATRSRLNAVAVQGNAPAVVLPSYNGARKLPVLTPLLALLLAREGLAVVMHGMASESKRIPAFAVLERLGVAPTWGALVAQAGTVLSVPTAALLPGLQRLLEVRQVVGLRNSAHSLVKLLDPCDRPSVVVASYTHPEYLHSMTQTFERMGTTALLLRGTEGEPVADARRTPAMDAFCAGSTTRVQEAQTGPLTALPGLPSMDADATAHWIGTVLSGAAPVPTPIAHQVAHIVHLVRQSGPTP
jgi:anthranilate phosphoribosyltransferase